MIDVYNLDIIPVNIVLNNGLNVQMKLQENVHFITL